MRTDMAKIVAKSRKSGYKKKVPRERFTANSLNWDQSPLREGMRAHTYDDMWGGNRDIRAEPFKRFVLSQVGLKWSKVYMAICRGFKGNPLLLAKALRIIDIGTKTSAANDTVFIHNEFGIFDANNYCEFYVDPVSGTLQKTERATRHRKFMEDIKAKFVAKNLESKIVVSLAIQLHKLNGIWFELSIAPLPSKEDWQQVRLETNIARKFERETTLLTFDVALKKQVSYLDFRELRTVYGANLIFARKKRQLNESELKSRNISNA